MSIPRRVNPYSSKTKLHLPAHSSILNPVSSWTRNIFLPSTLVFRQLLPSSGSSLNSVIYGISIVCVLLGISLASVWVLPTFWNPLLAPSSRAGSKYLAISLASVWVLPTFRNPLLVPSSRVGSKYLLPALEDGTDRFQNVGRTQTDAGDIPKRTHTIFKTRRKPEIKITVYLSIIKGTWITV